MRTHRRLETTEEHAGSARLFYQLWLAVELNRYKVSYRA